MPRRRSRVRSPSRAFVLPKSGPLFSVQEGGILRNGPLFCVRLTPSRVFVLPKSGPLYVENIPYNAPDNDQNKEYDIYPGRFGIKTTAACAYIIYGSIYDNPCNVNDYKWCKIVIAYSVGKSEFETTECETADSASWTV